jgi:acyl carrier protein phosphodiesterase
MNCLAHIYLSGSDVELLCGNFIGDGVKGQQVQQYTPAVQNGILLHRFIDHYTDNHPITAEARAIIRPQFRKYAGVVLDVYFDHFLGVHWQHYHPIPLPQFVDNAHLLLDDFEPQMPEKMQYFFKYMKMHQWLLNYRNHEALDRIFKGMARRTPFESNMEMAVPVLQKNNKALEAAFRAFFPELEQAVQIFIENRAK